MKNGAAIPLRKNMLPTRVPDSIRSCFDAAGQNVSQEQELQ